MSFTELTTTPLKSTFIVLSRRNSFLTPIDNAQQMVR
ncbi:hypothetical protein ACVI1I_006261 [Bradyrhizobium sp. USDA 4459]